MTLNFTRNCPELVEKLNKTVTSLKRYKFQEVTEDVIGFKMISENGSEARDRLMCCTCNVMRPWLVHRLV